MNVADLRHAPGCAAVIADRCWHAWWTGSDVSLEQYQSFVEATTETDEVPLTMVARDGETYAGSALLIDNDLDARPQYAPWIAALWVEPAYRRRGVAAALLRAARNRAYRLGHPHSYLCATAANSPYYAARGFQLVEGDVGDVNVFRIANEPSD